MTPRALVEEVTGSIYYTMPFCDHVAEFYPKWPQDGSFEKSQIALLQEFINPPRPTGRPDWDYEYMFECLREWDAIG